MPAYMYLWYIVENSRASLHGISLIITNFMYIYIGIIGDLAFLHDALSIRHNITCTCASYR